MKKVTLAAAIAAICGAQTAGALELLVNGQPVGVSVTNFNVINNDVESTLDLILPQGTTLTATTGDDGSGDDGSGDDGSGDDGSGDDGSGDDGSGDDGSGDDGSGDDGSGDDGSGDDGSGGDDGALNCDSNTEIKCDYGISAEDMASTAILSATLTIPKGKILSSKFFTSSSTRANGTFGYEEVTGVDTEAADVWISITPGGAAVSTACQMSARSFIYSLGWLQYEYEDRYCVLNPSTRYFVNMKHTNVEAKASKIRRFISK